jgi:hypothetical protein
MQKTMSQRNVDQASSLTLTCFWFCKELLFIRCDAFVRVISLPKDAFIFRKPLSHRNDM